MASFQSSSVLMPMLFLTTFLFLNKMVNSTKSLSFSFPEFVPQQPDLIFQGHAVVASTGRLYLNQQAQGSTGRALYAAPVQIWDSKTGNVASFTTSFSFYIYNDKGITADGLAFFLAPVDSQVQVSGGLLGLFPDEDVHQSNQVVAVEFDTFPNGWDPEGRHIGIDVNGIKSVNTTSWSFWSQVVANVTISYEASTKVLAVFSIYPSTHQRYRVSSVVDIKNVLPEFVRVGFSASSGVHTERHDVLSWSFESKLPSSADSTKGHDGAFNNVHVSTI